MLWYIGHLFGCRLRRREKGHGVSIITALRLLYHMRPTRCYRQSGKDFASKIVQPARGRLPYRAASGRLAASFAPPPQASHVTGPAARWAGGRIGLLPVGWPLPLLYLRCRKPPMSWVQRHAGPAAVSDCFRLAGRFLCSTSASASLPCHGAGTGRRPYRTASGRLAASFAVPPLPQASHVTGPARAGGHIGLLPVGWPLPLLHLRCRKPPTLRGRRGPAAVSGCFRSAGRFLCSTSAAASLPRHGASGTLVRRKTCAL